MWAALGQSTLPETKIVPGKLMVGRLFSFWEGFLNIWFLHWTSLDKILGRCLFGTLVTSHSQYYFIDFPRKIKWAPLFCPMIRTLYLQKARRVRS